MPRLPLDRRGLACVTPGQFARVRKELTIDCFDPATKESWKVYAFDEYEDFAGIPRAFAWEFSDEIDFSFAYGYEMVGLSVRPELRKNQGPAVDRLVEAFASGKTDMILQAYTGSGKTVMGCEFAARIGVSTLILVDQEKLRDQWIETLVDHFGYDREDIGIVQGKTVDYEHDFTIGMVQSIYNKEFEEDFYEAFGVVIFDECHVCGAEQFSNVLSMFPARRRLGMSATPDRPDSLSKLVKYHLDGGRVVIKEDRLPSRAYVINYPGCYSFYANRSPRTGRYITEIVEDGERNRLIVEAILAMHKLGRKILVIGERIEHLEGLCAAAVAAGVPEDETLLYTGKENYYKLDKNPKPLRDPEGYQRGTEYSPLIYTKKERKVTLSKRNDLLVSARIIFSTYAVFSKGVDVPDLDTGIDATPKSAFVQIHGRILRRFPGKKIPIWITIRDFNSYRAEYQFGKRIAELIKSNAETYTWSPGDSAARMKNPANL